MNQNVLGPTIRDAQLESALEPLTLLWNRILHRENLGADDDFFREGGTPLHAIELFRAIGETWRSEIAPETIYLAPTINSLSAILNQSQPASIPAALLMNRETRGIPIFVAPGIGGSIMEFFHVVQHLQIDHPVYGLQPPGLNQGEVPLDSVEDFASRYIAAIGSLQPHGPYYLIGCSFGGLVMLEVARRLLQRGENIGMFVMLDSYPDLRFVPVIQRALVFGRRLRRRSVRALQRVFGTLTPVLVRRQRGTDNDISVLRTVPRITERAFVALAQYRPRPYHGTVKFVRSAKKTVFPASPHAVWGKLIHNLEIETVNGDHVAMITKYAAPLALLLSGYLREAFGEDKYRSQIA